MLLCLLFRVPRLKFLLARIHYLKLYAACLETASKGWFIAWLVCVLVSLVVKLMAFFTGLVETFSTLLGFPDLGVMLMGIVNLPLGILIVVICLDCMIAGLRARNQFLLGSLFSSKAHDERIAALLGEIERTGDGKNSEQM